MIIAEHEYHIVELNSSNPPPEVFEWLMINFGAGNGTRWMYRPPNLYFSNSKDHLLFTLRWS
jgi:hypothetical protein